MNSEYKLFTGFSTILDPFRTTPEGKGALLVKNNIIHDLGSVKEMEERYPNVNVALDCSGCAVAPGLVDAHTHLFQTIGRTLGDGLTLLPWLERFMLPLAAQMTRADAVAIAKYAALHSMKCGTTALIDNHYAPTDFETIQAVCDAVESVGMRGVIARGVFGQMVEGGRAMGCDPRLFFRSKRDEIDETAACINARAKHSRVQVWPMPENIVYVDPELIAACHDLSVRYDVGWQAHCSESKFEVDIFQRIHGLRPVNWLYKNGMLSDRTSLAHGIWLDDEEIGNIGESGASIVHCPVSNQYLGSGIVKLQPLRAAGANVALGTDGTAVGGKSIFEAMKSALLMQRLRELDPSCTNSLLVFEMGTIAGSKTLRQNVGKLEIGSKADFLVIDLNKYHHHPTQNTITDAVMFTESNDIRDVIIDGEVVIKNGCSTKVDETQIMQDAIAASKAMVRRADLQGLLA